MSSNNSAKKPGGYSRLTVGLLLMNLVLILFPPIYLGMANGNMTSAMIYAVGTSVIVVVSLFILPTAE